MKIRKIFAQNINSIPEICLDFTASPFDKNACFAITGDTGSGKSTIFDAICLALYHQTPRLGKITKSSNELMRRGSEVNEMSARVEFSVGSGKAETIYRAYWQQSRATSSTLQPPTAGLTVLDPVANQFIAVEGYKSIHDKVMKIVEITGLNFTHFTKSVLLAQGAFADFMKCKDNERADLLEKITGTEIYSQISKAVFERAKKEKDECAITAAPLQQIKPLEPEEVKEKQGQQTQLQKQIDELNGKLNDIQNKIKWREDLNKEGNRLEQAESKANECNGIVTQTVRDGLLCVKTGISRIDNDVDIAQQKFNELSAQCQKKSNDANLEKHLSGWQSEAKNLKTKQNDINNMTAALTEKKEKLLPKQQQKVDDAQTSNTKAKLALESQNKNIIKIAQEEKLLSADQDLSLSMDSEAQKKLAELAEQLCQKSNEQVVAFFQKVQTWQTLQESAKKLRELTNNLEKNIEQKETLTKSVETKGKELEKKRTDYQLLNEKLDNQRTIRTQQLQIQGLQQYRDKLQAGDECPLCGSRNHPLIESYKTIETSELDKTIQSLEGELQKIREEGKGCRSACEKLNKELAALQARDEQWNNDLSTVKQQWQDHYSQIKDELLAGVDSEESWCEKFWRDEAALTQYLNTAEQRFREQKNKAETASGAQQKRNQALLAVTASDSNLQLEKERYEQIKLGIKQDEESKKHLQEQYESAENALSNNIYAAGFILPTASEDQDFQTRLLDFLTEALQRDADWKTLKKAHEAQNKCCEQLQESKKKWHDALLTWQERAKKLEIDDGACLSHAEDTRELSVLVATLTDLENKYATRNTELVAARALEKQSRDNKNTLEQKNLTPLSAAELQAQEKNLQGEKDKAQQEKGVLQEALDANEKVNEQYRQLKEKHEKQLAESKTWNLLDDMLGSSNGAKYQRFAQTLTLDQLLICANKRLNNFDGRYRLQLKLEQNSAAQSTSNLELQVVDSWNMDTVRSTDNLSGGESFMVSLALALGLSDLLVGNLHIDSLFLDEGFGTLDQELLNNVLNALIKINDEGKTLAVISHTPEIKEKFSLQIQLNKSTEQAPSSWRIVNNGLPISQPAWWKKPENSPEVDKKKSKPAAKAKKAANSAQAASTTDGA